MNGRAGLGLPVLFVATHGMPTFPRALADSHAGPASALAGRLLVLWVLLARLAWCVPHAATPLPESVRFRLESLKGFLDPAGIRLRWITTEEHGVMGFRLSREAAGAWQVLDEDWVVANNAIEGGRYEALDPGAPASGAQRYRMDLVLEDGSVVEWREFEVEPLPAEAGPQGLPPADPPGGSAGRKARAELSGAVRMAAITSPVDLLSSPVRVKIRTTVPGVHFVSAASLASLLGQPENVIEGWVQTGRLSLFNRSNSVVYIPGNGWVAAGRTGPGFFFHAESLRDNYTSTNIYWLSGGTNRVVTASAGSPTPQTPGRHRALLSQEQDAVEARSVVQDPEDDFWFWTRLTANSAADTWNPRPVVPLDSSVVLDPSVPAVLKLKLYGSSRTAHLISVAIVTPAGVTNPVGTHRFSGSGHSLATLSFPSDRLAPGNNQLLVRALLDTGALVSQVYVDGFDLEYSRACHTVGSTQALEAGADGSVAVPGGTRVMTVGGFGTGATAPVVLVLDVTDPRQPRQVVQPRMDLSGTWRASIVPESSSRRYAFLAPGNRTAQAFPAGMSLSEPANLSSPTNRGAYVVVAHPSLSGPAGRLAQYRGNQFRTRVVSVEEVYDEFSHGIQTPHAIREFLRVAWSRWLTPPRYLVLYGDGTYDYRNLQATGDCLVPPLMIRTPYGLTTSDSLYGDVLGNREPRVFVGRFPVRVPVDGDAILAKIQSYEAAPERSPLKALLVADQPDLAGDFIANIRQVEGYLGGAFSSTRVHPDYAPAAINRADITNRIQAALNGGVDLVNYIGHGAVDRFGSVPFLWVTQPPVTASVLLHPPLANGARLPVLVAMTCIAGMYSSPGYVCLAEAFLGAPGAGAVATISPTGLSQDADAVEINREIMELMACGSRARLGDIVGQSFSIYNRQAPEPFTPVWIYNLLGDPALQLARSASTIP